MYQNNFNFINGWFKIKVYFLYLYRNEFGKLKTLGELFSISMSIS